MSINRRRCTTAIAVVIACQLVCTVGAQAQTPARQHFVDPNQFLLQPQPASDGFNSASNIALSSHRRGQQGTVHYVISSSFQQPIDQTQQFEIRGPQPVPRAADPLRTLRELDQPLFQIELADAYHYPDAATLGIPRDMARELSGNYQEAGLFLPITRHLGYGMWMPKSQVWASPNYFSGPLYFEQENLERYGHHVPGLQPVISGAHFFSSVAILPYKIGAHPPYQPAYSLGYYRPGSCNPAIHSRLPFSYRGLLFQGLATAGAVSVLP